MFRISKLYHVDLVNPVWLFNLKKAAKLMNGYKLNLQWKMIEPKTKK